MRTLRVFGISPCLLALSALLGLLSACGGGGDEPAVAPVAPPPPAPTAVAAGQSRAATLGAAGGSVVLSTGEGASFTLSVPAGAVPEGTELRLETAAITPRQRFHLRLSPAGLLPSQPLTLTLALPAAMSLPSGGTLVYDGTPVPYTRLSDGRIELSLRSLAGASGTAAAAPQERAHALTARALATTPAPACAGVPTLEVADGGLTDAAPIAAADYGSCMLGAVNALAARGDYEGAVRLSTALAAYLQSIGAPRANQLSDQYITQARSLTCTAYRQVLDTAAAGSITTFDSLVPLVKPVLFWEMVSQQLGAECPGIPPGRYLDVIESLTSAALRYYASKKGEVVDVASPAYTQAVQETRAGNTAVAQVRSLEAPASAPVSVSTPAATERARALATPAAPGPVLALAKAQLQDRAQPAILDAVLQAPWQRCRDSGSFDRLIELMALMDKPASVKAAAQYCSTQLQAQARDSAGSVTATLEPSLGGVAAGNQRIAGSLNINKDGKLSLSGPIRALQCPAGQVGGSESLEIKLGSTVLQTISSAPYLANSTEIDIAQALQTAGLNATNFTGATLTLTRTGSPCGGYWGDNPAPLLALDLSAGTCVPEQGRNYCITVLADLNSSDRDFHGAFGISNRGAHVHVHSHGPQGGGRSSIWHRGRATPLPADFVSYGDGSVADDGTVAGATTTYVGDAGSLRSFRPAVFSPSTGTLTWLLAAPVQIFEQRPQMGWSTYGIQANMQTMSISPQGRVTFSITEQGQNGWADSDLGFCGSVRLVASSAYSCYRHTLYESHSPHGGPAAVLQTRKAPEIGPMQFPIFDGGEGLGRYGYAQELAAVPSTLGGVGAYRPLDGPNRARNLVTDTPKSLGTHYAADRHGRTISDTATSGIQLLPAHAAVPAGWSLGSLGMEGHLQVCNADVTTTRLLALESGQTLIEVTRGTAFTHQGRQLEMDVGCNVLARAVDALGRLLGYGWIAADNRGVPLVLTPAGVVLP